MLEGNNMFNVMSRPDNKSGILQYSHRLSALAMTIRLIAADTYTLIAR
jgi:hypothetical protein